MTEMSEEKNMDSNTVPHAVRVMTECVVKTKKDYPALWEEGGGMSNTGHARIIADREGCRKKPVYIRTGGHLALGEHALFIIEEGDIVIDVRRHHDDYDITIKQIRKIRNDGEKLVAEMEILATFSEYEWDNDEIAKRYHDAINVAKEKSRCYHCRSPHYATDHPEFKKKITIKFDDPIAQMTELCNMLGYRIEFSKVSEDSLSIFFSEEQKKIYCEYVENELAYKIICILNKLEKLSLLEIEKLVCKDKHRNEYDSAIIRTK